jgi:hypothetical protein
VTDHREISGGAMTGATGDLTPDDTDRAFEPGELREVADAAHHADVTQAQAGSAPAQEGETGDPGGPEDGGPTNLAARDDGYGSRHGLSPDDPAYRMERHPSPTPASGGGGSAGEPSTRIGGDEVSEGEERF